jgi:hypothetical protein
VSSEKAAGTEAAWLKDATCATKSLEAPRGWPAGTIVTEDTARLLELSLDQRARGGGGESGGQRVGW